MEGAEAVAIHHPQRLAESPNGLGTKVGEEHVERRVGVAELLKLLTGAERLA
jgi:hypothetical protein